MLAREFAGEEPFLLTFGDIIVEPSIYSRLIESAEDAEAAHELHRREEDEMRHEELGCNGETRTNFRR